MLLCDKRYGLRKRCLWSGVYLARRQVALLGVELHNVEDVEVSTTIINMVGPSRTAPLRDWQGPEDDRHRGLDEG